MSNSFTWDKNTVKVFFATLGEIASMIFGLFEIFKKDKTTTNKVVEEKSYN